MTALNSPVVLRKGIKRIVQIDNDKHKMLVSLAQMSRNHYRSIQPAKYVMLLLLFCFNLSAVAKKSEDNKIPKIKSDKDQLTELIDIAWDFIGVDSDSVLYYLEQAADIIHMPDSELKADYYNALGLACWFAGKPMEAREAFSETLKLNPEKTNITQRVVAHNNLGMILTTLGKMTEARENLEKALELDELLENHSGVAKSMYDLARLHMQMGHNTLALNYIIQTIDIQKSESDTWRLLRSLNMLGNIYFASELSDNAVEAYRQSHALAKQQMDYAAMSTAYNNISAIYSGKNGNFDSTLYYAEKGLELARQHNYQEVRPILNANIARAYQRKGDIEEALMFFRKSLSDADKLKSKYTLSELLLNFASAHQANGQIDSAKYYLDQSLHIASEGQIKPIMKRAYMRKASIDSIENRLNDYILHFHKGLSIRDSLRQENNQAKIAELMIINEVEKKSAEIDNLRIENEWNRKLLIIGLIVSFLIMSILVFIALFIRNRKTIVHQKLMLHEKENEQYKTRMEKMVLEGKLKEKEMERMNLESEMREQELVYKSLQHANLLVINQSIKDKLSPYQFRFTRKKDQEAFANDLKSLCREAARDPLSEFETMFTQMHDSFYEKLLKVDDGFSRSELQMCALLRMNLPSKEIANMLNLSVSRVDQTRHQIRKKLNLDSNQSLTGHLILI